MFILAIEDQPEFVLMLRSLLRGHTVVAFPTIWEALNECKKMMFDLVLLDLTLTDSRADETLSRVQEIRELGSSLVVVMTGSVMYDDTCHRMGIKVLHKDANFPSKLAALLR